MDIKIDKKNEKILGILDWNARMPFTQIAKKTRLNKDVVKYRIQNLERDNVIEEYYTVIDTEKLGLMTVRIYFDFINTNKKIEEEIIKYLDTTFKAGYIFSMDGEFQLGILTWETSTHNLYKKITNLKENFGQYIQKENLSIITSLNHYPKKFLSENTRESILITNNKKIELKKEDLIILKELAHNARSSSVNISEKLNIPQTTVLNKIKNLAKKNTILGYRAKINTEKLGYQNYFIEVYTKKGIDIKKIETWAKSSKNCIYSTKTLIGADIELETEFKNKSEIINFIESLKIKFPSIKKIKYWSTNTYFKINYFPEELEKQI